MVTKERIDRDYTLSLLWCTKCLRNLTPDEVWLSDDTRDGRRFCFNCAPDDAIRLKDTIQAETG